MDDFAKDEPSDSSEIPELESALPDEYDVAPTEEEKHPPRPLPAWVEKKLSSPGKGFYERSVESPVHYPFRELLLLVTGITGFLALVCLRFGMGLLALAVIVLGLLFVIGLMILERLQRRRETAERSADGAESPAKRRRLPLPDSTPERRPFQFSLADLMITMTAMACLMSLASLVPGENKFSYFAGISGIGVFVGLIVISVVEEVHRVVRLVWAMLFLMYIFSSLAAIFWR
ncbi:MAG: hypothetical protein JXB10_12110 [Pirellulales bacterium]|nr:hypothetical protein [Pirellulales bacterium]